MFDFAFHRGILGILLFLIIMTILAIFSKIRDFLLYIPAKLIFYMRDYVNTH